MEVEVNRDAKRSSNVTTDCFVPEKRERQLSDQVLLARRRSV